MKITLLILFFTTTLFTQNIKGTILDKETNNRLEYVNIYFERGKIGTISDFKGKFNLNTNPKIKDTDILQFSILGYSTKKLTYSELKLNDYKIYLTKKFENIKEITLNNNRQLKPYLHYKKLPFIKGGLFSFGSTIVNDKIYVVGGNRSRIANPLNISFKAGSDLNRGKHTGARPSMINSTYKNYTNKLYTFNFNNEEWTKSEIKFRKKANHNLHIIDNKLFVIGGKRLSPNERFQYLENKIEVLDLEKQIITIDHTNPHQAVNFESFLFDNCLIVLGGSIKQKKNGDKTYTDKMHLYDTKTGNWYELGNMTKAKETKGVLIENTIYLIGGYNEENLAEIESYNLLDRKWEVEGKMFHGMKIPAIANFNNIIYIYENGKIFTYNIINKTLNEYKISVYLYNCRLHIYNEKLYLLGGYKKTDNYNKIASNNMYSIDLDEFLLTKIHQSKQFVDNKPNP